MSILNSPLREVKYEYPDEETQAKVISDIMQLNPGMSKEEAEKSYRDSCEQAQWFINDEYRVSLRPFFMAIDTNQEELEDVIELCDMSVSRHDKQPCTWEQLQAVKTEIMGADVEAVELYPCQSRNFETRGQYHLFCMPPGQKWPVGFEEGCGLDLLPVYERAPRMEVLESKERKEVDEITQKALDDLNKQTETSNAEYQKWFAKGKQDHEEECFLCSAETPMQTEAWILGQKAAGMEQLYNLHITVNQDNPLFKETKAT